MSTAEDFRKPILPGKGASDYERYLRTDELLLLQKHSDELLHKDTKVGTEEMPHSALCSLCLCG